MHIDKSYVHKLPQVAREEHRALMAMIHLHPNSHPAFSDGIVESLRAQELVQPTLGATHKLTHKGMMIATYGKPRDET